MAEGDQLWQRGISYGSYKWSGGSVTAATSDPGGSVIGGMDYCTTIPDRSLWKNCGRSGWGTGLWWGEF